MIIDLSVYRWEETERVSGFKFLDVHVSEDLTWSRTPSSTSFEDPEVQHSTQNCWLAS